MQKPSGPLTVDQYMALPEKYVEIVDGEVIYPSPHVIWQVDIISRLFASLGSHARENNLGEVWISAQPYILDVDDSTGLVRCARQPDLSFIAREREAQQDARWGRDGPMRIAPDLAIEAPSSKDMPFLSKKLADYLRYGVRLVWVIDSLDRLVRVYTPEHHGGRTLHEGDTLSGDPVLPGWSMGVVRRRCLTRLAAWGCCLVLKYSHLVSRSRGQTDMAGATDGKQGKPQEAGCQKRASRLTYMAQNALSELSTRRWSS
jgi:Uma2 family endonuclease